MGRHLRSIVVMIEVTSRHVECTNFNLVYSQMSAVALQSGTNMNHLGATYLSTLRDPYFGERYCTVSSS